MRRIWNRAGTEKDRGIKKALEQDRLEQMQRRIANRFCAAFFGRRVSFGRTICEATKKVKKGKYLLVVKK